ncbi:hypothetical protein ACFQUU_29270 [Herbaspirillum sp. GCM10030257]|uniref:hypothetical protein n=1 Tax=Herbaspirillum sp. GCM10030257 TaxID=3273393 RepID=UPI00360CE515
MLIGHFDEFSIFLEGRRLFSRRTQELVWTNTKRFADVIGPGHNAMNKAGWHPTPTAPSCFTAVLRSELVAAAGATHTNDDHGNSGCNLAYGLLDHVEGRGLAKLLAALAVRTLTDQVPAIGFVNVQSRASNERSAILARSFGMQVVQEKAFGVIKPGSNAAISYCTYRGDAQAVASAADLAIAERFRSTGCDREVIESAWDQADII